MNNQVTCFLLYGSDNQQNKTIKGLTESPRTDQIFLLTDHPEDKDIPTEKCHILFGQWIKKKNIFMEKKQFFYVNMMRCQKWGMLVGILTAAQSVF